uniref:Target of rapamycin complex subunit LST8 n=1 Tax=Lactuca sativa TaxID=4236 RepID=A0A9R1X6F3_LACSA|nr:hypothetical protein LSAT_V11C600301880 [Lactuca sativa]
MTMADPRLFLGVQTELISGDQNGNILVWDLTANSCSCELVDTSMRSLTVMWDGSLVVAVNNKGTCYVWRLLCGTQASGILKQNEVNSKSSTKMESPIPIPMTEYLDLDQVGT